MPRGVPPPAPPFTAEWTIHGEISQVAPWSVRWHLLLGHDSIVDAQTVFELHEDLLLWSEPFFNTVLAAGTVCSLSRLLVTGITTQVSSELYLTAKGFGNEPAPASTAVCVDELVQARGRGRQGRFYLPPPQAGEVGFAFQLIPSAQERYSLALAFLFNGVNAITHEHWPSVHFGVLHRSSGGAYLASAVAQPVDTFRLARVLSTQTRRLRHVRTP